MKDSFYSESELKALGLKTIGEKVLISRKTSIYNPNCVSIGNNVRIDDFCILSGNITIGSNVHISAYVALYGKMGIEFQDYTGISPKSTIFSAMDDFSGKHLIGPIHQDSQISVTGGKVTIERFAQIGAHCVIFPNLTIGEGSVIGAMGLVLQNVPKWGIYIGQPVRFLKERKNDLQKLAK
jgi:galactoside O-acetyltransferase